MIRRLVQVVSIVAALGWTALYVAFLWAATYAYCYGKAAACGPGVVARMAVTGVYLLGVAAAFLLVRFVLRRIDARARQRRDGIL